MEMKQLKTVTPRPQGTRLDAEAILAASSFFSVLFSLFPTLCHLPSAHLFLLLEPSGSLAELGLELAEPDSEHRKFGALLPLITGVDDEGRGTLPSSFCFSSLSHNVITHHPGNPVPG